MSRQHKPQRLVRIQANGHFFDIDITLPEKKANAQLRRLKRIQTTGLKAIREKAKNDAAWVGRYKRPRRLTDWKFNAVEYGIKPTIINITTVQKDTESKQ